MSELAVARALYRSYTTAGRPLAVLSNLNLQIQEKEIVAITGESGVGKSTLLHILGALDRPSAGSYTFRGRDVFSDSPVALARFRNREIGFVFQFHNLLAEFDAMENVMMPAIIGGATPTQARSRAMDLLADLGMQDRAGQFPSRLSGGEQQRVAIARALMSAGSLLLADEPTGNLDPATALRVFELLRAAQRVRGLSVVLATHNEMLASLCDRVFRLRDGALSDISAVPPPRQEMARS